ncbi:MAG TPA: winged helix-turn-helix domain-containing protein [Gaiellaceae bacterium]|nr:winged helix-turn-helix domain-containing protein [Gaiellaceae bacterium]
MSIGQLLAVAPTRVDVAAGTGFELLVALAGASARERGSLDAELREALEAVGDTAGESWLNLLGIPLDLGAPYSAPRLSRHVAAMEPVELRRHLLGRYAWSWCTLGGTDTIEAAAAGDAAAARALLAHDRYYAGRAKAALSTLIRLGPDETRQRLAKALEMGARLLIDGQDSRLEEAAAAAAAELEAAPLLEAIERATDGYRYAPEPEAEGVVLIPHVEPEPWLVLAQHRATRLIVFRARAERDIEEGVAALGRALADPKRVEILGLLARGVDRASELVARTGLSRSTVHHHLSELREARLVDLEGNARAYRYLPRPEALAEAQELLSEVFPRRDGA